MNACATALANGVPLAIHSDAPVTPLGPLFTAWCAVNRQTASGRILGTEERISVTDALRTITLGAAYTLGLDGEGADVGRRAPTMKAMNASFEMPSSANSIAAARCSSCTIA